MSQQIQTDPWALTYSDWEGEQQPLREALCTLGNGYFATRGAAEEMNAGGVHYPGTYLAGGYNRLKSEVSERIIENEDLVNWPNWLCLSFRIDGGTWFRIDSVEILEFLQRLDLKTGLLERRLRFRDAQSRETSLVSRRLVHMADPHLAAIQWKLTPENWSGRIEIRSALDGTVSNQGVARYRDLSSQHLENPETGLFDEDAIYLAVQTNQSHLKMVQGARTQVYQGIEQAPLERENQSSDGIASQVLSLECERKQTLRIEKVVAVYTSRDHAISEPWVAAKNAIARAGDFEQLFASHSLAWDRLWKRADIELKDGDDWAQLILRLHVFHLLATTSFNSIDLDVGVPARGLHGEAYRGHIFWDELFIFPFLNLRIPELTRTLLMYRYRRLEEARHHAREAGYAGAMYPWQSGSSGREENQTLHLNPKSGRWVPDNTHRQRHINAAIPYNVWQYFEITGDMEFLSFYGMEMILEIARFWASIAHFNAERDRFEIHHVVGPDEFHTQYPNSESLGLNNNAYTNVMAVWVLRCARQGLEMIAEDCRDDLTKKLGLTEEELEHWDHISRKMFIPLHEEGIISQFEGYENLEEFDWEGYRKKYDDIQRLDRILEAEGDSPNRYKASKQADVLMLFYLLSAEELKDLFQQLDYPFDEDFIPRNIHYYMERTSHGSTLSRIVHSWVLARSQRERAWELFSEALESDVADVQGGTTPEGIHLGAMAGTVDVVQRCYTGINVRDEVLWLNPCLPEELDEVKLRIRYRGHWMKLILTHDQLTVCFEHGGTGPAHVGFRDRVYVCHEGDCREFNIHTGELQVR